MDQLVLKYSHNIVEHLGLKLYQNQPTRVIAELVSNAWDADALSNVINLQMDAEPRWVSVLDDGHGMSREVLADAYLVIGHPKRAKPTERSKTGRAFMGRKGIGKLASFGIARIIDIVTAAQTDAGTKVIWLRFDRDALLGQGDQAHTYVPKIVAEGIELAALSFDEDTTGQVRKWADLVAASGGTGTAVIMTQLSIGKAISEDQLLKSLGSRFTLSAGGLMSVLVNGKAATEEATLPHMEFRIPENGVVVEKLSDGKEIRYWVGFVQSASWPQDQAGVGVYAHHKIAQDRPFVFGLKGREIYSRYMLGFIEADWLDELDRDIISTDRTSINWDAEEVSLLHARGQQLSAEWIRKFEAWRLTQSEKENKVLIQEMRNDGAASKVTASEEEEIVRLVSKITPSFGKGEDAAKRRLVETVADAWTQKPMRRLVTDLWETFSQNEGAPPEAFTQVIERLSRHSVPESLNLAVVFAQRAFALARLQDYVHHGNETHLQKLLEKFPWIIDPDSAVLTANQPLKTAVRKAEEMGQLAVGRRIAADVPDTNRPDFVFLSSPKETEIVIVELKNPQHDLTIDNRAQLNDYMTWFEANYPKARLRSYLVGRVAGIVSHDQRMTIVPWTEVLQLARDRNVELLSAMLLLSGASDDTRAFDAISLGGDQAEELLERLAGDHQELRELMDAFEKIKPKD
ncbi:ATP-binding protein [Stenotrophomonas lactitubi]|uniref:ATP-binding protein n=1 Tax=Stenotrophomonas lactitubi TaxID=2045214 RepID=UPI001E0F5074|nr:ATP-binding protein [Stenotrophomonas lactitubi]CAH0244619.1 hypothetical protein SRABI35_02794 [Stenotrophomonas lactitubi]